MFDSTIFVPQQVSNPPLVYTPFYRDLSDKKIANSTYKTPPIEFLKESLIFRRSLPSSFRIFIFDKLNRRNGASIGSLYYL